MNTTDYNFRFKGKDTRDCDDAGGQSVRVSKIEPQAGLIVVDNFRASVQTLAKTPVVRCDVGII